MSVLSDRQTPLTLPFFGCYYYIYSVPIYSSSVQTVRVVIPRASLSVKSGPARIFSLCCLLCSQDNSTYRTSNTFFVESAGIPINVDISLSLCHTPSHTHKGPNQGKQNKKGNLIEKSNKRTRRSQYKRALEKGKSPLDLASANPDLCFFCFCF